MRVVRVLLGLAALVALGVLLASRPAPAPRYGLCEPWEPGPALVRVPLSTEELLAACAAR